MAAAAMVTTGVAVLSAGAWTVWIVVDPYACEQAEAKIAVATYAIDRFPRELVARSKIVNDCDSSNDGWVEVTAHDRLDVDTATATLEQAGWSSTSPPSWAEGGAEGDSNKFLSRQVDGQEVTAAVQGHGSAITITVALE